MGIREGFLEVVVWEEKKKGGKVFHQGNLGGERTSRQKLAKAQKLESAIYTQGTVRKEGGLGAKEKWDMRLDKWAGRGLMGRLGTWGVRTPLSHRTI